LQTIGERERGEAPVEALATIIGDLVRQLCSGEIEDRFGLRGWAARHGALPAMADMGGAFALTDRARIVSFAWDREDDTREETEPRLCRMVLFRASLLYTALAPFVPRRPDQAHDCPHCGGTGKVKGIPEDVAESLVCYCGGIGWLLRGETA